ncbi:uncharacterized protein LOC131211427 [Anopheles bellator]|uniref:uncharacterized protein LOC131211427 n=1 Tax=Anopheles bellator TaxID=139047 RepID=UPI0026483211|nr:uncharacterized protein LOC131211427 [Anopheles bellator]
MRRLLIALFSLSVAVCLRSSAGAKVLTCTRWHRNQTCFIEGASVSGESGEQHSVSVPARTLHVTIEGSEILHFSTGLFDGLSGTAFLTLKNGFIPAVTFRSDGLNSLRVDHTELRDFTVQPVENRNLNTLIISGNPLRALSPTIRHLTGLSILDLSNNQLESVNLGWLEPMGNLLVLDLSANRIVRIDVLARLRLSRLKNLWINHNRLRGLDFFPDFAPSLRRVRLVENRWSCAWVQRARAAIWVTDVQVYGAEYRCPAAATGDGGLCCYDHDDEVLGSGESRYAQVVSVSAGSEESAEWELIPPGPERLRGENGGQASALHSLTQPPSGGESPTAALEHKYRALVREKEHLEKRFIATVRELEGANRRVVDQLIAARDMIRTLHNLEETEPKSVQH